MDRWSVALGGDYEYEDKWRYTEAVAKGPEQEAEDIRKALLDIAMYIDVALDRS
jgi:long-subunit fatty acid transport protein